MADHVRLTEPAKIERIRGILERRHWPLLVSFAAQMTHHPLLIAPATTVEHIGFDRCYSGDPAGVFYVGIMEFGNGLYPFTLGYVHSGYLMDKLRMSHIADARNVTVFLNALGHPDGVRNYLATVPMDGDHVDQNSEVLRV
jgi:hypothetical protein